MSGYYIKRGEKIFGPHTMERLSELRNTGKMKPTDLLSESATGPFESFAELEQKLFSLENASRVEPAHDAFSNIDVPDHQPFFADALSQLPVPPTSPSPTHLDRIQQAPSRPSDNKTGLGLEDTKRRMKKVGWKWIAFPWLLEEDTKYFNLRRWIFLSKLLNRVLFVLFSVLATFFFLCIPLLVLLAEIQRNGFEPIMLVTGPVGFLFSLIPLALFLVVLHIGYVASMAGIELLCVFLDIESNTSK